MKEVKVDALIATSFVNVKYFSGYACWLDPLFKDFMMSPGASTNVSQRSYALLPLVGEPALIAKSLMATDAADLGIDLCLYGDPGLDQTLSSIPKSSNEKRFSELFKDAPRRKNGVQALVDAVRSRGLTESVLGLETEGLNPQEKHELSRALPKAKLRDCSNLLRLIRAAKTPGEIERLAKGAQIAESAALQCLSVVRPGVDASDLVPKFRSLVGAQGGDFDHFSYSLRGFGICGEAKYTFRSDDVLFVDYGCVYSSYFSDTGTTLSFAELPTEIEKRYAALQSCFSAGVKALRPGTKSSAVQKAMSDVLKEKGISGSFPHGHGMGLEIRDYPILVPPNGLAIQDGCISVSSDLPLEEGMVVNLEAPLFMAAAGALQIENTFLITIDGSRPLTAQDRKKPIIPA